MLNLLNETESAILVKAIREGNLSLVVNTDNWTRVARETLERALVKVGVPSGNMADNLNEIVIRDAMAASLSVHQGE